MAAKAARWISDPDERDDCRLPQDEGATVNSHDDQPHRDHIPGPSEASVPEIELDENIAPRPEEEVADLLRAEPDVEDHAQHPE
jgi:hypothetical protein